VPSPRVAIVIPAHNPGGYLRVAVDSVIAQTFADWEAVIVDDGGEEDLSSLSGLDRRVTVIRQANTGVSAARNRGIAETSADLIAFLDADDSWAPQKLERQIAALEAQPECVLCTTDFQIVDGAGERIGPGYRGFREGHLELLGGCGICISTVMARRGAVEAAGGFDPAFSQCADWDLWLRLALIGPFARADEILASYRVHGTSMSRNYMALVEEGTRLLRGQFATRSGEEQQAANAGIARLRRLAGTQAYDELRQTHRIPALARALRLNPSYTLRSLARYALRRR